MATTPPKGLLATPPRPWRVEDLLQGLPPSLQTIDPSLVKSLRETAAAQQQFQQAQNDALMYGTGALQVAQQQAQQTPPWRRNIPNPSPAKTYRMIIEVDVPAVDERSARNTIAQALVQSVRWPVHDSHRVLMCEPVVDESKPDGTK